MSDLEWTECIISQQMKAQGIGVVYWLSERRGVITLCVNPDSIDPEYNSIKGTEAECMKFAELLESKKKPKCHVEYDKYAEIQRKCHVYMAKQSFKAESADGENTVLILSRARQAVREVFFEFDKVIEENEELRERLANQKRRIE